MEVAFCYFFNFFQKFQGDPQGKQQNSDQFTKKRQSAAPKPQHSFAQQPKIDRAAAKGEGHHKKPLSSAAKAHAQSEQKKRHGKAENGVCHRGDGGFFCPVADRSEKIIQHPGPRSEHGVPQGGHYLI